MVGLDWKRLVVALLAGLLGAAFLAACGSQAVPPIRESSSEPSRVAIKVAPATLGSVSVTTSYATTVEASGSVDVVPLTTGRVEKVLVNVGDEVKEGQVLAELSHGTLDAQLQQARANLATVQAAAGPKELKAQAMLDAARAKLEQLINPLAEDLKATESALVAAQSNAESAKAKLERLLNPSASDLQRALTAVATAQNNLESSKTRLERLQNPLLSDVQASQSALAKARSDLASAKIKLDERRNPSASDLQNAQSAVSTAKSKLESAQTKLDQTLDPSTADLASAQKAVADARAKLSTAQSLVNAAITQHIINSRGADSAAIWQNLLGARVSLQGNQAILDNPDLNQGLSSEEILDAERAVAANQEQVIILMATISSSPLLDPQIIENSGSLIPEEIRSALWAESETQRSLEAAIAELQDLQDPGPDILVPVRNEVAIAQASLDSATETLKELQNPSERTLSLAQNDVAIAQAAFDSATEQFNELQSPSKGTKSLAENTQAIAQAALDAAKADLEELKNSSQDTVARAQYEVDAAQAGLDAALAQSNRMKSPKPAELAAAKTAVAVAEQTLALNKKSYTKHDIEAAQARVNQIEQQLGETQVLAPFDGYVTKVWLSTGAMTSPRPAIPVVSVVSKDILVYIQVEETGVGSLRKGQQVEFTSPGLLGQALELKIDNISPGGDQKAHTFSVQMSPVAADPSLKPGMSGEVSITTRHDDAVLVPKDAIQRQGGQYTLFVVQDGQARLVKVQLGLIGEENAEILRGVKAEDKDKGQAADEVVIQGQNLLNEATPVTIVSN